MTPRCQRIMARLNRCERPALWCVRGVYQCTLHTAREDRTEANRVVTPGSADRQNGEAR